MNSEPTPPAGWPTPDREGQVEVLLLGTYHMDNPGLDEVNVDADDVLAEARQAELRDLVDRLAEWEPDRIAVERPYDRDDELNDRYEEYRSGERAYDREEAFPSPDGERDGPATECRSEVVQVGFRLADRLGHDRVAAVDEHPEKSRYEPDPFAGRGVDSARKTDVPLADPEEMGRTADERLASSTLVEYHRWLNRGELGRDNHDLMFDSGVRAAVEEPFGSPTALAYWYDRNVRIVHHVWRTMDADDDRVLVVVGNGHVRALRHLFTEAPMFHPVSPLPLLESEGE
ncbi:DUF5694 domain-containing protein [Halobium salinum]|uniref:DUF5694 domain-containing protein n=1 Tax=Halobium salinum TaxID=1364940 RepID=A0ABD5PBW0_9EURY|nr:DUF5694 domain-containing protein [Halobium salinum]